MNLLFINPKLSIPVSLLTFTFSCSSGPGGQNVNKLSTRVCVSLDVANCPCLTDEQKQKLTRKLKGRMDKNGILQVCSQEFRSQHANRNVVMQRLVELIAQALKPVKVRKATKPTKGSIERRLQHKRRHALKKKQRSSRLDEQ